MVLKWRCWGALAAHLVARSKSRRSFTLFRGIFWVASASQSTSIIPAHSMAVPITRSVRWYLDSRHARNQEMWCWKWWSVPYLKQLSTLDCKQSNLQVQYPADMSKGTRGFLKFIPRDWYRRSPSPDLTILGKWMDMRLRLI